MQTVILKQAGIDAGTWRRGGGRHT